jgi:hypothetical protein
MLLSEVVQGGVRRVDQTYSSENKREVKMNSSQGQRRLGPRPFHSRPAEAHLTASGAMARSAPMDLQADEAISPESVQSFLAVLRANDARRVDREHEGETRRPWNED